MENGFWGSHTCLDAVGLSVLAEAFASDRGDLNGVSISTCGVADGTCSVCGVTRAAASSVRRS